MGAADYFRPGTQVDPNKSGGNPVALAVRAHWMWIALALGAWFLFIRKK